MTRTARAGDMPAWLAVCISRHPAQAALPALTPGGGAGDGHGPQPIGPFRVVTDLAGALDEAAEQGAGPEPVAGLLGDGGAQAGGLGGQVVGFLMVLRAQCLREGGGQELRAQCLRESGLGKFTQSDSTLEAPISKIEREREREKERERATRLSKRLSAKSSTRYLQHKARVIVTPW